MTGFDWLRQQPLLFFMAIMTAGNIFVGAGYSLIVIIIAQDHHASSVTIGLLLGVGGMWSILGGIAALVNGLLNFPSGSLA